LRRHPRRGRVALRRRPLRARLAGPARRPADHAEAALWTVGAARSPLLNSPSATTVCAIRAVGLERSGGEPRPGTPSAPPAPARLETPTPTAPREGVRAPAGACVRWPIAPPDALVTPSAAAGLKPHRSRYPCACGRAWIPPHSLPHPRHRRPRAGQVRPSDHDERRPSQGGPGSPQTRSTGGPGPANRRDRAAAA
jgi:hypothetical protein